jgi:predicted dehydrogenase/nucleoside-diphosphate-sugar epimerase
VKVALIGCGAAATHYYLPALRRVLNPATQLCLVDSNVDRARALASKLGRCPVFADHREVLDFADGVIIAVPHFLHYRMAMDALNAGVHVLCEKPLAETLAEVENLNAAARSAGAVLCVNNTRRMLPQMREVKRLIETQTLGRIRSISYAEGNLFEWQSATSFYVDPRSSSKGILLDLGAHALDLICWWLNQKPALVQFEDDSFGGPESVASVRALAGRCDVRVMLNRLSAIDSKFTIVAEKGTIEGRPMEWQRLHVETAQGRRSVKLQRTAKTYPEFVIPFVRNFIDVINGKEKPLVSGADVQPSIALMEECYKNRRRFAMRAYARAAGIASPKGKVLVTGAGGCIGARLVELLHLAGDRKVRAGIRRWSSAARLGRFPVEICLADVMDPPSLEEAFNEVRTVVHCAIGSGPVNETGTRNLLERALKQGVEHFIHLSTADVYGHVDGRVDENQPFRLNGTPYNASKIAAEKLVWEFSKRGLPVTVLRPSIVYGPFSTDWSTKLAMMFLARKGGVYEQLGEGVCNAVFVDDVVAAIVSCLENQAAVGQAFNIAGPEAPTWNDYYRKFNRAMALPPLPAISPTGARLTTAVMQPARVLGGFVRDHCMAPAKKIADSLPLAKSMMKATERALKMTPAPARLKLLGSTMLLSGDKIREEVGFVPSWRLDDGLQATVEWLRQQGFFGFPERFPESAPADAAPLRRVEPTSERH